MFDPWFAAALVVGYVFGSIPFGLLLTRLAGLGDIRAVGSGNIGATNVLRTGRKDLALATLVLDSGKAGFACLLFTFLASPTAGLIAGGAAFFGHCFPVWLKFQGGKGVATFLGVLLAAFWPVGVLTCLVWLGMALLMRMSSLAALTAALAAPVLAYAFGQEAVAVLALFLAVLLYWRHKDNIGRILSGDEPKIGAKKA